MQQITEYKLKEYRLQCLNETSVPNINAETPQDIFDLWNNVITNHSYFDSERECLVVWFINTRRKIKGYQFLTHGTLDTLLAFARDIFRAAIVKALHSIIISHNHPSGDPSPLEGDIKVTKDLIHAGRLIKIELLDHVICGIKTEENKGYCSLRELGYFYI